MEPAVAPVYQLTVPELGVASIATLPGPQCEPFTKLVIDGRGFIFRIPLSLAMLQPPVVTILYGCSL
jgi:hypothetical protein